MTNFTHVLSHGLFNNTFVADYDKHIAPIEHDTDKLWALIAAYSHGGLKADFDKDILPFKDDFDRA